MKRSTNYFGKFAWSFAKNQDGSVLPLVGVVLTVLLATAAFAVDLSASYQSKNQLLTIAEASSLAAATKLPAVSEARSNALQYAALNKPSSLYDNSVVTAGIKFGTWDENTKVFTEGGSEPTSVQVTAHVQSAPTYFAKILGHDYLSLTSVSVATGAAGNPGCIIALDPSINRALELNSAATVSLTGCEIQVASNSSSALYTDSNAAILDAERVCVRGESQQMSNSSVDPNPLNGCTGTRDPFADVSPPSYGGCDHNSMIIDTGGTVTLSPGVYCGGIEIKNNSNVIFQPGEYIIKDGSFKVDSNASITGDGTGFYLTGTGAAIDFDSNSTIDLTAPSSGDMSGLIFFADRSSSEIHNFNSNSVTELSGAVYVPTGVLIFNSNSTISSASTCTQFIGAQVVFNSNSGLDINADFSTCPGGAPGGGAAYVVLRQ